ncbi:MAG: methionine gamma-lyase family protein [Clostridia bacterium]|nr:methionine gamma-lyase family protein [Clostridia bacterium]
MKGFDAQIGQALGVDPDLLDLAREVRAGIAGDVAAVDEISRMNTGKVLQAFAVAGLGEHHFGGATGYGYDDVGRERLENAFAAAFGAEAALVRMQMASGTHALSCVLFGILRPGDTMVSACGAPYDTMTTVIGCGARVHRGSLAEFGVGYREAAPAEDGGPDLPGIARASEAARLVLVQRSRGYSWRRSLSVDDIREICSCVKAANPEAIVFVDNCYGEFTEDMEPTAVGADIAAGSLIKNAGGGVAPCGGYIVGKRDYVEMAAERLNAPGLGSHCGPSLGFTRDLALGLFLAPLITGEALAGSIFAGAFLSRLGFEVSPMPGEQRHDIVLAVKLGSPDNLSAFCRAVQQSSPIDSGVTPEPAPMPGYDDQVIMAAGAFTQGASIELSADAPLRPPYTVYLQGGLIRHQVEFAMLRFAQCLRRNQRQRS